MENTHTERESMVFYKSFFEAIEDLPGEEFKKCACAILNYGLKGEMPQTNGIEKTIMVLAKPQIDKNMQRWMNAQKSRKASSAEESEVQKPEGKDVIAEAQKQEKLCEGEYRNVLVTKEEKEKLEKALGRERSRQSVDFLSRYIKRKPDFSSACHYEDIRSWVQDALEKQKKSEIKPRNPSFNISFEDLYEKP